MSVAPVLKQSDTHTAPPEPLRWSLAEYQHLARVGAFAPNARVELMNGEIIRHMPPDPPHSNSIDFARDALARAFVSASCFLRSENPLAVPGDYQPQPDVAVIRGAPSDFRGRFPTTQDVLLIVEIAASSLTYDRTTKRDVYARNGIEDYWIVNVTDRQLEVFRGPINGVYTQQFTVAEAGQIAPITAPQSLVPIADLLP